MPESLPVMRNRVQAIDVWRGIIMVIMALDHARDFLHKATVSGGAALATDPTNLATTTVPLFFTRWITHLCAPAFVFLAGTSAYLLGQKRSKPDLRLFLIKRGLWLILVEVTIVGFGWTFNPFFNLFIFQVIWAIGVSMILLGLLVVLPVRWILGIGLVIVAGHNLLDKVSVQGFSAGSFFPDLVYFSQFAYYPFGSGRGLLIVYSFLPWTGLMLTGYAFGTWYAKDRLPAWRIPRLIRAGLILVGLFVLIRLLNIYGDPLPWSVQPRGPVFTFLSFMNVNKYPASLLYLLVTIGITLLMLAYLETRSNRLTAAMNIFGRVPLFYYVLHFYLIHLLTVVVFYLQGFGSADIVSEDSPFLFRPGALGLPLYGVYLAWFGLILVLYPICRWYERYKSAHSQWWLSYL